MLGRMWHSTPIPIALTIDDAPSVCEPGGPELDPSRMDRIREALLAAGIRHCVAFVIGDRADGNEGCLRRWLEAGFELGNHTEDHVTARSVDPQRFVDSVRACHQRLLEVGAFDGGRQRFFRHPYGDRGRAGAARHAIATALGELGYTPAEVTVNLYDYAYDPSWVRAHAEGEPTRVRKIEARWLKAAAQSIRRSCAQAERLWGPDVIHVAACHFGPVTERRLGGLARAVAPQVRWTALSEAVNTKEYQRLISDVERETMPSELLFRGLGNRILRRAARTLDQSSLGPRWPHLTR